MALLPLLLPLLWALGGARAEGRCDPPERLQDAELEEEFRGIPSFAVGSRVSFICRPGYMRSPGKSLTLTCGPDGQWSPRERFCTERRCAYPEELNHGFITVTDLTFGSDATFSCEKGYRLVGADKISCVIRNEGVDWDKPLPVCEIIPCEPPPSIANGRHTEAANYVYQISVKYSCDDAPVGSVPFSLIGSDTIFCTSDEHSNGVWSGPPPQCRVVKCENPTIKNGKKISGFGPSYSYKDSVRFECDPGYSMQGSEIITCEENSNWSPKPTCKKSEPGVPGSTPATSPGSTPATSPGSTPPISSGSTPVISFGRVAKGQKLFYSVGDQITIECYAGYTLHGEAQIRYIGGNQWAPGVPTCHLSGYIIAIICVLVAAVVLLAAFWAYKKFFSQNGKRDSTPCTAEYKICKA